ncbi:LacI family DNA-binding transcriptional regulator (plasmid) [Coraliomargarita sp. W4R53]
MTSASGRSAARVGVREVAALAGVSSQTVSRVINEHSSIRPETRAKVLAAIAALDYRVNNAARALGTSATRTLGVIASDATLFGPSVGIAALDTAARAAGRWIATAYADAADAASVIDAAERLRSQGVDGLIVLAPHARTLAALAQSHGSVPLVALHTGAGAEPQRDGAQLAVEHLLALGHRDIARISGPTDWFEASARDEGIDAALAMAGLERGAIWVGDWTAGSAAAFAPAIAEAVRAGEVTAVIAANDQMALGLIAGLSGAGLKVPNDVSVTGFDDNPDAAFYRPALTTVRLDMAGEARRAVAAVLGVLSPPADAVPRPAALIVRGSTVKR